MHHSRTNNLPSIRDLHLLPPPPSQARSSRAPGPSTRLYTPYTHSPYPSVRPAAVVSETPLQHQAQPRLRQVPSCTGCARRKIRGNRLQPCGSCGKRGEADQCESIEPEPKIIIPRFEFEELQARVQNLEELQAHVQNLQEEVCLLRAELSAYKASAGTAITPYTCQQPAVSNQSQHSPPQPWGASPAGSTRSPTSAYRLSNVSSRGGTPGSTGARP